MRRPAPGGCAPPIPSPRGPSCGARPRRARRRGVGLPGRARRPRPCGALRLALLLGRTGQRGSARQLELFLAAWSLCCSRLRRPSRRPRTAPTATSSAAAGPPRGVREERRLHGDHAAPQALRRQWRPCRAALAATRGDAVCGRAAAAARSGAAAALCLGHGTRRHLARLVTLLCRPVRWLAALALRSPLGPTLRAAVRVLGACLSARAMLGARCGCSRR